MVVNKVIVLIYQFMIFYCANVVCLLHKDQLQHLHDNKSCIIVNNLHFWFHLPHSSNLMPFFSFMKNLTTCI